MLFRTSGKTFTPKSASPDRWTALAQRAQRPGEEVSGYAAQARSVFRFGPWLRSTPEKLPAAAQATAGSGCIRNPRADRALRLHCCRALASQSREQATAPTTPRPEIGRA